MDGRRQEAERLRDYFEVQLLFAEALALRSRRALPETCLAFTNLHRRFGLGRIDGEAPCAAWTRYAEGLERCGSGDERLEWTVAFFADAAPEASTTRRFGCFSYELMDGGQVVRIHFSNRDSDDGRGPLVRGKADRRRSELGEMFAFVRAHHADARAVRGGSWLYNLEAYRRLFPPEYAASVAEPGRVRLDGTSSWGQLLDFTGQVKPDVRAALLANLVTLDPDAPWTAFPLRALAAQAPIEGFWRFYGVGA
ncbi:MAG TPA: hypothetical protein VG939_02910 [Caulobacteraceae bacterium]|nr:hypothetical protein [Caulobacteraceae bacterium]